MITARFLTLLMSASLIFVACDGAKDGSSGGDDTGASGDDGAGDDGAGDDGAGDDGGTDTGEPDWEEGCITVSGIATGFASLADAVEIADDGDTITLCEGTIEETVAITESLQIVGPGPDLLTWNAPTNQPAVTVSGTSNVSLSGFSLTSTRNGVEVGAASAVTVSDVAFLSVGNTAVKAEDATELLVEGCTFAAPPYGAVEVRGGSAAVSGITVTDALGFGVHAADGADVAVSGSSFSGTLYSHVNDDGTVDDGFALWGESGAALSSADNTYTDNFAAAFGYEADLYVSGDVVTGGYYAYQAVLGEFSIADTAITDPYIAGVYSYTTGTTPSISNVTVIADPELVEDDGSYGVALIGDDAAVDGLTVEGFNAFGVILEPFDNTGTADLANVSIHNVARNSLYLNAVDATLTEVSVTDHRLGYDLEELWELDPKTGGLTVAIDRAAVFISGAVDWSGGEVSGSGYLGVTLVQGALTASDLDIRANAWSGIFNFYGTLSLSDSVLSEHPLNFGSPDLGYFDAGAVFSYYGTTTLSGNTFQDSLGSVTYEVTSPNAELPDAVTYSVYPAGVDVISQGSPLFEFINNTSIGGHEGVVSAYDEEVIIQGNTWEDYNYIPLLAYNSDSTATVSDNQFTDIGYYAFYCSGMSMEIDDLSIQGSRPYTTTTTWYDKAGKEIVSEESSFYNYQFVSSGCDLEVNGAEFSDTPSTAMYIYGGSHELYDLSFTDVNSQSDYSFGSAIYLSSPEQVYLVGADIDGVTWGNGIFLSGYSSGGVIDLSDVTISDVYYYGIYGYSSTTYNNELTLSDVSVANTGSYGTYLSSFSDLTVSTLSVDASTSYGFYGYDLDGASLSDVTITGAGSYGMPLYYSADISLNNLSISGSAYAGVYAYYSGLLFSGDSEISANSWEGLSLYNSDLSVGEGATLTLADNTDEGMYAYTTDGTVHTYDFGDGLDATKNGYIGLAIYQGGALSMTGGSITDNGRHGVFGDHLDVTELDGIEVSGNADDGLKIYETELTLTDSLISDNGGSGLDLVDSVLVEVSGNTIRDNGEYGMVCEGSSAEVCEDNTFVGNTLGDNDCEACGGGAGDTGDTGL
jgi:predicted heme/steroid binding protein